MQNDEIINKTELFVQQQVAGDSTGHDWWHIHRVRCLALQIQNFEGGNTLVVELAALLHDISDWKFNGGNEKAGGEIAEKWLKSLNIDTETIAQIKHIIDHISYKGANTKIVKLSLEGQIVQDADRLDAVGAIGIARAFAYGGANNRVIYEPELAPELHKSFEAYKNSKSHTINHFY